MRRPPAQFARRGKELRGGRMWHHQMKTKPPFTLAAGRCLSLLATVDVIRDLASVKRWVRVTPG